MNNCPCYPYCESGTHLTNMRCFAIFVFCAFSHLFILQINRCVCVCLLKANVLTSYIEGQRFMDNIIVTVGNVPFHQIQQSTPLWLWLCAVWCPNWWTHQSKGVSQYFCPSNEWMDGRWGKSSLLWFLSRDGDGPVDVHPETYKKK